MANHTSFSGDYLRFDVELTSLEQFYSLIRWLNSNAGGGQHNWTAYGRIRKHLVKRGSHVAKFVVTSPSVSHQQVLEFVDNL